MRTFSFLVLISFVHGMSFGLANNREARGFAVQDMFAPNYEMDDAKTGRIGAKYYVKIH